MNHKNTYIDRPAVVSGSFYPDSPAILKEDVNHILNSLSKEQAGTPYPHDNLLALICPHAGYVFSGKVAAAAYTQLRPLAPRKRIFLIGSSHCTRLNGASIYNQGNYLTPLGQVKVDIKTADQLINNGQCFEYSPMAHDQEHSLEVQLPFLQTIWGNSFQIVPIIIGTQNPETLQQIAQQLQPWFHTENLFIISTDLSHYPSYTNAKNIDHLTTQAILTGEPNTFLGQIEKNKAKNIENLSTSICGWTSVLTLLYLTNKQNTHYHKLMYLNSGDSKRYGDKEKVVGYQSMAIYEAQSNKTFTLTNKEKNTLLELAKKAITTRLNTGKDILLDLTNYNQTLQTSAGAFVSTYIHKELNGCIGLIEVENKPLARTIAEMAVSAAFHDHRFNAIEQEDIDNLSIEISVLTPLKKIKTIDEIILGKHGILIRDGINSGTFLPQVAHHTNWTLEEFLGHCAKDKAGIGWSGWKNADIYTYEAIVFSDMNE